MKAKRLALVAALLVPVLTARANVTLEWRFDDPGGEYAVGDTVRAGLYAVAPEEDHPIFKTMSSMDVLVAWDPAFLSFDCNSLNDCPGLDTTSPHNWSFSGLADDSSSDDLNGDLQDGCVYYQALASFSETPVATPEGLLVATFVFEAAAPTNATEVLALSTAGTRSVTVVFSGVVGGLDVTGDLLPTNPPATIVDGAAKPGDFNQDDAVNLADFLTFVGCFGLGSPAGSCTADQLVSVDLTGDGSVDLNDFMVFVANFDD